MFIHVIFLVLTIVITASADFMVNVKNSNNNAWTVGCSFVSQSNYYEPGQKTTTVPQNWSPSSNGYDLKFHRVDSSNSEGGRCITSPSNVFSGNGIFSADIYIHSNVPYSDGVFTVAILNLDFANNPELDLFVANVYSDTIKSGKPYKAEAVSLSKMVGRWLTVRMKKQGDSCQTDFISSGSTIHSTS
jgi:hypothetical protein